VISLSPWLLGGSLVAASIASGYGGWKLRDADYQAYKAEVADQRIRWEKEIRKAEDEAQQVTQALIDQREQSNQEARVVFRDIIKEVPTYVTQTPQEKAIVANGGLPLGFVWNHNKAATGNNPQLPQSSGFDPARPTGVDLSTLARTLGVNYELCQEWKRDANTWREWHQRQEAARDTLKGRPEGDIEKGVEE